MSRAVSGAMLAALLLATAVELEPRWAIAQQPSKPRPTPSPSRGAAQPHGEHGTPKGWKFSWPKGDPAKGREVFAKLECYSCHEVKA